MNVQTTEYRINSRAKVIIVECSDIPAYAARYENVNGLMFADTSVTSVREALNFLGWRHLGEGIPMSHLRFMEKLEKQYA